MNNVRIQMASSESTTFTVLGLLHQLGYRAALIVVCCKVKVTIFLNVFYTLIHPISLNLVALNQPDLTKVVKELKLNPQGVVIKL